MKCDDYPPSEKPFNVGELVKISERTIDSQYHLGVVISVGQKSGRDVITLFVNNEEIFYIVKFGSAWLGTDVKRYHVVRLS